MGTHTFDAHPGTSVTYAIPDDRLSMTIRYPDGHEDRLGWELIEPGDLIARAARVGLAHIATCSFWDPAQDVGAHVARYQCVFERTR